MVPAGHYAINSVIGNVKKSSMIRVQEEPFDIAREIEAVKGGNTKVGGVACFVGTVRELTGGLRFRP